MPQEQELILRTVVKGLYEMDSLYLGRSSFAACYILEKDGDIAIIETNTNHAVPLILRSLKQLGLSQDRVKYVIVTHIHLDHAGGAGKLISLFPRARLVVHSRGARHMVYPERLIASVKQVYGEKKYRNLYGDILPVPEERLRVAHDGDVLNLGQGHLRIMETPGHAKHHFVVFDTATKSLFSGDAFGIGYPRFSAGSSRWIFPSTAPVQFDPELIKKSFESIGDLKPERILLTHFGSLEDAEDARQQLNDWIDYMVDRAGVLAKSNPNKDDLTARLADDFWAHADSSLKQFRGQGLTGEEREFLKLDIDLNAQGVAHYIQSISR
jgi:glyoxylase-like metal-dependent hydrolase (beta-lactamase superfamily II)